MKGEEGWGRRVRKGGGEGYTYMCVNTVTGSDCKCNFEADLPPQRWASQQQSVSSSLASTRSLRGKLGSGCRQ